MFFNEECVAVPKPAILLSHFPSGILRESWSVIIKNDWANGKSFQDISVILFYDIKVCFSIPKYPVKQCSAIENISWSWQCVAAAALTVLPRSSQNVFTFPSRAIASEDLSGFLMYLCLNRDVGTGVNWKSNYFSMSSLRSTNTISCKHSKDDLLLQLHYWF